jgi:hypothetical protein
MSAAWVQIAHAITDRTRLRSPLLRNDVARCEQVADALAALPGVERVTARPYTGSVLVEHSTSAISADAVISAAARVLGAETLASGTPPPVEPHAPPFSAVARKLVHAVREIDEDIRRRSAGSVDLGTLATLGFFGAGAAEVMATGKLPMPPWFNLAWWGFRTFVTTEQDEICADTAE